MASSGSTRVNVSSDGDLYLLFSWSAGTQNVANNYTPVSWTLKLVSTKYANVNSSASKDYSVMVDGQTWTGTNTIGLSAGATKTLASGSKNIYHNSDGKKDFNYSFSQDIEITYSGSWIGTKSGSGSGTLNTIPRASEPTLSASNVKMGNAVTIYTNRKSDSFTHTISYSFHSVSETIATGVGTSVSWTPPTNLIYQILNSTSGTCTITCKTYNGNTLIGTKTVTLTLTVPNASQPSLVTWPDTTQNVTIGNEITVHMNKKADFTHTVRYTWGNKSGTIATGVVDNCSWKIPMDFCNDLPNATSGWGTLYVDSYNGNALVGTKSVNFTGIIPDSVKPSISSIALSENGNAIPINWGVYVQGKSKLKVVTTASGSYSSTIKTYKITGIDSSIYNSADFTSGILQLTGTRTITVTVTDSRGRTATKTITYNCIAYSNPLISLASATRCNDDGTANDEGEYVKYSFKASVSSVNSKNTYEYKLGYKKSTDSSYTYIAIDNSSYTLEKINIVLADLIFDINNSYDFQFFVGDYFTSTSIIQHVGTGFTLFDVNKSGKGFAFGKVSEKNALEIALPLDLKDGIVIDASKITYGNTTLADMIGKTTGQWASPIDFNTISDANRIFIFNNECTNRPDELAAWGTAICLGENTYRQQILIGNYLDSNYPNHKVAIRTSTNSGSTWSDWYYL